MINMDDEDESVGDKSMEALMHEEVMQEVLSLAKELGGTRRRTRKLW